MGVRRLPCLLTEVAMLALYEKKNNVKNVSKTGVVTLISDQVRVYGRQV